MKSIVFNLREFLDNNSNILKTAQSLENAFNGICTSCYPYEWDENHLSYTLMQLLRNIFSNRVIRFNNWSKLVDWKSFKNKNKQETAYGDIALIVNVQFTSGEILSGVACIEAKRSFPSGNFESMALNQLDRILRNVPYSHLLLYNHDPQDLQLKFPDGSTWKSHLWVSPINTANVLLKQTNKNGSWKVLRTSFPFTSFLFSRIFWGFDLDFRPEIYLDVVEGLNRILSPSFLGVVNVFYENQRRVEIALSDIWEEI